MRQTETNKKYIQIYTNKIGTYFTVRVVLICSVHVWNIPDDDVAVEARADARVGVRSGAHEHAEHGTAVLAECVDGLNVRVDISKRSHVRTQ